MNIIWLGLTSHAVGATLGPVARRSTYDGSPVFQAVAFVTGILRLAAHRHGLKRHRPFGNVRRAATVNCGSNIISNR